MSALRNLPVICQERQIGLLQSVTLDAARKRVQALIVACGFRGKRVALAEDVLALAEGFILIERAQRYTRADERPVSPFIRDTTGLLTGRVTDYAIDEQSLSVLALEMRHGYAPQHVGQRIWVYAYHCAEGAAGDVVVPASLGSELIFSREENETCVYPP